MTTSELTQDEMLHMIDHEMEQTAQKWARAEALLFRFKNMRDWIIAVEMKNAERKGFQKVAEQEREAKSSTVFQKWIDDSAQALEQCKYWEHSYWTMKSKLDLFLNQQSDDRARVRAHGGG